MRQQQFGSDPTASLVQDPRAGPGEDAGKVEFSAALDELMTAEQVAALLLLPASTVKDYARRGVLPSIKLGKHRRFVRSQVQGAIELLLRIGDRQARVVRAHTETARTAASAERALGMSFAKIRVSFAASSAAGRACR